MAETAMFWCEEKCDKCIYSEHHKCERTMHKGEAAEHSCMCNCNLERY